MACCPTEEKYGYDDSRFEKDVDTHFHCSICYNVLKEPMMCRNNEHIFCRECITEHLNVNSHTCPECNEDLTVDTLRPAPRVLNNYLSELKIKCDYSDRGCHEYIRLAELNSHVENCGFVPVKCSNEECEMMVNKRELIHHESSVCEYRKVKCHSCKMLEHNMEEMQKQMKGLGSKEDINQLKAMMVEMFTKLGFVENAIQVSTAINYASNALKEDILVAGGKDNLSNPLKSVERYSWKNNVWQKVSSMAVGRVGATSFVHEDQLFVAGGCDSDVIEVLNLNKSLLKWDDQTVASIPFHCENLRSIAYHNRVVFLCACSKNDNCAELCLTAPFIYKQLCQVPAPGRKDYTCVAFGHKILIFGGHNTANGDLLDNVSEFDVIKNEFKAMPALPFASSNMAGVRWGDQAVLLGGFCKGTQTNRVYMYDSKTGNTVQLPSMLQERTGCVAVITGNTIVVIGGMGKRSGRLRSVEAFTLGGYSWRYLDSMKDIRSLATAAVLPSRNFR